jgi:hypothetical protein
VPIPGPGVQLTTLSHVEDLAAMMALVPGNPKALKQHFNLCSDRCITFDGIARAVAQAVRNILLCCLVLGGGCGEGCAHCLGVLCAILEHRGLPQLNSSSRPCCCFCRRRARRPRLCTTTPPP